MDSKYRPAGVGCGNKPNPFIKWDAVRCGPYDNRYERGKRGKVHS